MTRYLIRYRPGTDLARRFPTTRYPARATFASREEAEAVRAACPNAESMDVVEVEG